MNISIQDRTFRRFSKQEAASLQPIQGMKKLNLPQFRRGEVQKFIKLILDQFRRIDGFWVPGVENKLGYPSAIELNDEVGIE